MGGSGVFVIRTFAPRHKLHLQFISGSFGCTVASFIPCPPAACAGYTYDHIWQRMKRIDERVNG
jgi:hypothetical protein